MEIAILVALIVLNGLFAMSEIARVTARKATSANRGPEAALEEGIELMAEPVKAMRRSLRNST